MTRTSQHAKETVSRDFVRTKIDNYYQNGDALIRDWSERDYGIDFILELFENGYPTGKIAFMQIKGTSKKIKRLKTANCISCSNVSISSLYYAKQKHIPFILIYASMEDPKCFYYVDIQSVASGNPLNDDSPASVTIRIPIENVAYDDLSKFFDLINSFYIE